MFAVNGIILMGVKGDIETFARSVLEGEDVEGVETTVVHNGRVCGVVKHRTTDEMDLEKPWIGLVACKLQIA